MNVILFGASGMVGSGVLIECLEDSRVESVLSIGRRETGVSHSKLRELTPEDLFDLGAVEGELGGFDACFYCLGISSAGMSEADYRRITYDLTVAVMDVVTRVNPEMTVCFVSGQGTDSSESSRTMWARVKGAAENYVLGLPVTSYMFRPGFIQPVKGVRSKTKIYQALYAVMTPMYPVLKALFSSQLVTTEEVGRAMLNVIGRGYEKSILAPKDILELAKDV